MIRTIIIDDEANNRSLLRHILRDQCPEVAVVGEENSVKVSVEIIRSLNPDLLLLDVMLSDGTGFELLGKLGDHLPRVIFITAYKEFAWKAFRLNAVDYLLKPVVPAELIDAIGKVSLVRSTNHHEKIGVFSGNMGYSTLQDKKIVLRTADKIYFIGLCDIIRCESDNSYTTFFFVSQPSLVVCKPLKDYEGLLCKYGFYRTHKSNIINLEHIKAFEKSNGGFIIMSDNSKVPLSDRKREEFFGMLEQL